MGRKGYNVIELERSVSLLILCFCNLGIKDQKKKNAMRLPEVTCLMTVWGPPPPSPCPLVAAHASMVMGMGESQSRGLYEALRLTSPFDFATILTSVRAGT